jgi:hypothetical protein
MTDDEKIKLVAAMAVNIYAADIHSDEYSVKAAIDIVEITIKQLKQKGMIKNE